MSSSSASPLSAAIPSRAGDGLGRAPVGVPRMVRQRRRRPGLIALSVALIAAGGLSGAVLFESSAHRTSVVVVARDVKIGSRITVRDLGEASIALDPAVRSVPAVQARHLVGQRAAVDLTRGSLLGPAQVTRKPLVGVGEQLVGVALKPGQLPATALSPGQKVLVVSTPDPNAVAGSGKSSEDTDGGTPSSLPARVVTVGKPAPASGSVVVDVAVSAGDGPALAARAATGDVALVVASRDGN